MLLFNQQNVHCCFSDIYILLYLNHLKSFEKEFQIKFLKHREKALDFLLECCVFANFSSRKYKFVASIPFIHVVNFS